MGKIQSETLAILNANSDFYTAFAAGCAKSMQTLWSRDENITCIHPGWPPLRGQDDVISSWQCILSATPPMVAFSKATVHIHGNVGYVVCCEHLEPGMLIATNIFINEDNAWKMVHYQASIVPLNCDNDILNEIDEFDGPRTLQ